MPVLEITEDRLVEGAAIVESTRDGRKQTVEIDFIVEGFGNKRDRHYYSAELLRREAPKFDGALMYSNHLSEAQERALGGQPRPWEQLIGRILPGTSRAVVREGDGKTVLRGTALISNPLAWQYIEADPEILQVSINARGRSRPCLVEGEQANGVEEIAHVKSVDVVSEAGAGGKINRITEAFMEAQAAAAAETTAPEAPVETPEAPAAPAEPQAEAPAETPAPEAPAEAPAEPVAETPAEAPAEPVAEGGSDCEECAKLGEGELCEGCSKKKMSEGADDDDLDDDAYLEAEEGDEGLEEGNPRKGGLKAHRAPRTRGRRSGEARSGRDTHPVSEMFGMGDLEDDMLDGEIDGPELDPDEHSPHERMSRSAPTSASGLARQIESEIELRVADRIDDIVAGVLAECDEAHEQDLLIVEHRYMAREQIRESDLPDASKAALMTEFHDFYAEPVIEGDEVVQEADEALREAVTRRIDEKRAELSDIQESFVDVQDSGRGAGADRDLTEGEQPAAKKPRESLDKKLDRELGIE